MLPRIYAVDLSR